MTATDTDRQAGILHSLLNFQEYFLWHIRSDVGLRLFFLFFFNFFIDVVGLCVTLVTVAGKLKIKHLYYVLPSWVPIRHDKGEL